MKRKTPQEKKALSYAKDCRNSYGENDKASRRIIPLRKAKAHRSDRKKAEEILQKIAKQSDFERIELLENKLLSLRRNYWKKYADEPLKSLVERKIETREIHAGKGKTARKKEREFVKNLKIEAKQETDGRWIAKAVELKDVFAYGKDREDAVERCRIFAGCLFRENLDAVKLLSVNDDFISVLTY